MLRTQIFLENELNRQISLKIFLTAISELKPLA